MFRGRIFLFLVSKKFKELVLIEIMNQVMDSMLRGKTQQQCSWWDFLLSLNRILRKFFERFERSMKSLE